MAVLLLIGTFSVVPIFETQHLLGFRFGEFRLQVVGAGRDGCWGFGLIAQEPGQPARAFAEVGVEIERCLIIAKGFIMLSHGIEQDAAIGIDAGTFRSLADCLIVKL